MSIHKLHLGLKTPNSKPVVSFYRDVYSQFFEKGNGGGLQKRGGVQSDDFSLDAAL